MQNALKWVVLCLALLAPGLGAAQELPELPRLADSLQVFTDARDSEERTLSLLTDESPQPSAPVRPRRKAEPLWLRVLAQWFLSSSVSGSFGLAGYLAGLGGCALSTGGALDGRCVVPIAVGLVVGTQVGLNLGVWGIGKAMGGRGTLLGTAAGWLVGVASAAAIIVSTVLLQGPLELAIASAVLPMAGAIIGYELSHAAAEREEEEATTRGVQLRPMVALAPGGAMLGVGGRF